MLSVLRTSVEATPLSRDRFVDAVRVFSIFIVVLGHWFMATPHFRHGQFSATNALSDINGLWVLTWLFQVMPLFFVIGGFSNSVTIDSMARKGHGYSAFVVSRLQRLLRPVLILLATWMAIALFMTESNVAPSTIRATTTWITQPLWFVAVYAMLIAFSPAMLRLHRRFGTGVLVALLLASAVVDVLRIQVGLGAVSPLNLVFVWLLCQQVGFFYADGSLVRLPRRTHATLAVVGLSAMTFLVVVGKYPGSMVGQAGDRFSNMSPPTLAIVALMVWQVGLAMLIRPAANRLLQRTSLWTLVISANRFAMTIYLWHLTALIITVLALFSLGYPQVERASLEFLLTKPVWFLLVSLPLVLLVAAFHQFDRPRKGQAIRESAWRTTLTIAATALTSAGILGLALTSLTGLGKLDGGRMLAGFDVTSTLALSLVLLGYAILEVLSRLSTQSPSASE